MSAVSPVEFAPAVDREKSPPIVPKTEEAAYDEVKDEGYGCCGWVLIIVSALICFPFFFIALPLAINTIKEYERGIILRLGKVKRKKGRTAILGAGVQLILPCTDTLMKADLRVQSFNIPPQEVLTRDAVSVRVDAVVYMKIFDAAAALLRVDDVIASSKLTAVSILRNVLGKFELSELLQSRDQIDAELRKQLDDATDDWGVKVDRVDIKDVSLPMDMQRAMAAEAQASRQAKAKVISAQGEQQAAESLRSAALAFEKNPAALHLRFLQTVTTIAAEQNSTILFPLPMEFLKYFNTK